MAKKIEITLPIVDIVEITYAFVICKENIMWQLHIYMYSATVPKMVNLLTSIVM